MTKLPIPVINVLRKLGQDINDARRCRRVTIELMAERAYLSRATIGKIEKGDPTTSMGGYAAVLFVLNMHGRIGDLVDSAHDPIGQILLSAFNWKQYMLEDEKLPKRVRIPKKQIKIACNLYFK